MQGIPPIVHEVMSKAFWVILVVGLVYSAIVIIRGIWRHRGSDAWPIVDGTVTNVWMERLDSSEVQVMVEYEFPDSMGQPQKGSWSSQIFRSAERAQEFINREMSIGKKLAVKYNERDPKTNYLELDSWTYSDDRPLSLGV